jgi:integrase
MPLYLRPPRKGKTPYFEIRGSHLGVRVEQSSRTAKRSDARKFIRKIEDCIAEHGCWPAPETPRDRGDTFVTAAVAYMEAGGERRHVGRLIKHFADKCPTIRRPKGSKGRQRTEFLWPDDAFNIIGEAEKIDAEFGLYLRLLISTGIRKGEGLKLLRQDVRTAERVAWLRDSKNEDPRMLRLRQDLVEPLAAHLEATEGQRLFRFNDGGHFKHFLTRARMAASGLPCPIRRPVKWYEPDHPLRFATFHIFRHSWATWFRIYAGGDVQGLVATRNWRDPRSAARYSHVIAQAEWDRVDDMPSAGNTPGKKTA